MIQRCTNIKNPRYRDYGGRGIKVCKRWLKFENFLEDMGKRPIKKTLDRLDNNKNYYKDNCKWSSFKEQSRNMRNNILLEFDNKKYCLSSLSEKCGIGRSALRHRLERGLSIQEAISKPIRKYKRNKT